MFVKKLLSVVLCLVLLMTSVVALIPEMTMDADAATYRSAWNGASASYKASKYYEHFQKVKLTGDGATDVIALALSQLGYHEGASTDDMDGISSSNGNYTEFNYNMGSAYTGGYNYEWCACFCSWSIYQAQQTNHGANRTYKEISRYHNGSSSDRPLNTAYIWREIGCSPWMYLLGKAGRFKYSNYFGGSHTPTTGNLIFFTSSGNKNSPSHIGLVVYSDGSYVYTVEGNTSDASGLEPAGGGVFFKKYALSSSYIVGYGILPYTTNSSVAKIDYSGANPGTGLYVSNAVKYVYSTSTGSTRLTDLPRFTVFEVTEIASNGRLKATFTTSSGSTVTGWILNNSDRVIQITSNASTEKVSMTLKCVDENGNTLKTETLTGNKGSSVTITPPAIDGYICTQSSVVATYTSGATVTLTYKTVLDSVIASASGTRYCDYAPAALETLRSTYAEAVAIKNNSSSTSDQKIEVANRLQAAINNNIYNETIVSTGKSYTTPTVDRTDDWADDGKKLTDGNKKNLGDNTAFSGWAVYENGSADIVVDLGANVSSNVYRIYTSINESWGIYVPAKLTISVSNDNSTWTEVGVTDSETETISEGEWTSYIMTVRAEQLQNARYVKFNIAVETGHIWLDEVEVASSAVGATGEIYVNKINSTVLAGDTVVFTPAFGEITTATANHSWTLNVVLSWSAADNCYIVKSASYGSGDTTPSITLATGELLIACHTWETNVTNPVYRSDSNITALKNCYEGQKVWFSNVDVANATLGAAATVALDGAEITPPVTVDDNLALNKGYTITGVHSYPDENGKTMTDGVNAPADALYDNAAYVGIHNETEEYLAAGYAAITVDLGDAYNLDKFVAYVATSYNADAGICTPAKVSVFVSNDNSTWTEAGSVVPTDTTTSSVVAAIVELNNAVTGRYVQFRFETKLNWVMVAEVEVYGDEAADTAILGDVNADGKVDSADYILVKRACFNSYTLTADEQVRGDVDKSDKVDSTDYVIIKRIAFGTYK